MIEDALEVMQRRGLGDHRAAREARAARGVLHVRELVRAGRQGQLPGIRHCHEVGHGAGQLQRQALGGLLQQLEELDGRERGAGLAIHEHLAQMPDIGLMATQMDGGRQRHGHECRVLAGVEHHHEIGMGVRYQRDPAAPAQRLEPAREHARLIAQLPVRKGGVEPAAAVVVVEPGVAGSSVIEGLRQRGEVRATKGDSTGCRCQFVV